MRTRAAPSEPRLQEMMCYYVARPAEFFCGMDPDARTRQTLTPMDKPHADTPEVRSEAL